MATSFGQAARYTAVRLSMAKLFSIVVIPLVQAIPISRNLYHAFVEEEEPPMSAEKPTLWIYLAVAIALVLLGGAFAGLTIALMGQDEIYLQVIKTSGEGSERNHAAKVLRLLKRGKHWVLVTLLLGNVITNETLPIVLDRSLGGGWPAVLGSTVLIVIFGEIIPQSICVRYGLPIGAWMSSLVLILMYILSPIAWPTAKLLDRLLGEDHGTTYKKAGLKTLVTLHKSLGADGEQLNSDEVTIISAVLDLKAKPVGDIMTPMEHVFTLSADTVLDEKTMEFILGAGFSRIPVYAPDNEQNFVGMLLVKILITYDPEDCKRVREFSLATLPETSPETSCLDIVNFFQEGKSHMVLVSEFPGWDHGALGVITLEDVIEELIGEEIIDESDVYIDVHKAIRRTNLAPRSKVPKGEVVMDTDKTLADGNEASIDVDDEQKNPRESMQRVATVDGHGHGTHINGEPASSDKAPHDLLRRTSSAAPGSDRENSQKKFPKPTLPDHLKHLGPSNPATRPRQTRYNTVKIKPGGGSFSDGPGKNTEIDTPRSQSIAAQGGVGPGTVSAAKDAKDGIQALQAEYGSIPSNSPPSPNKLRKAELATLSENNISSNHLSPKREPRPRQKSRTTSQDTIASLHSGMKSPQPRRGTARSGSITENIVDAGGIKKTVLELTSSSDDHEDGGAQVHGGDKSEGKASPTKENDKPDEDGAKKKKRRRKRPGGSKSGVSEDTPLLGQER